MPGEAAVRMQVLEAVAHGWDLARATGQVPPFDPEIVEAAFAFARAKMPGERPGHRPPRRLPGAPGLSPGPTLG